MKNPIDQADPETTHQEIKQEFASFAPWNQFAPDQLVIDSSSDDDQSHTDSPNNDQPEAPASFASSNMDFAPDTSPSTFNTASSAPATNIGTLKTASSTNSCASHLTLKQELDEFSKAVKSGLRFVKAPLMDRCDVSEGGVPAILDQLPSLDIHQPSVIWEDPATPMFLPEVQYFIKYWRVAFFAGVFIFVDEIAAMCLQTLAPDTPYQLIKPHLLDLSSIVARRNKDTVKLISSKDEAFEEKKGDFHPSFNTLGLRAFTFHLRPHLNIIERRELQAFWASLPTFDLSKPNHNPARPCKPAAPRQVGPALWDWSEMLQPARWFICPCALAGHACAFTGEAPVNCRGWHDVCTEQICNHGPDTRFIHTGSVCGPAFDGKPCGLGRNCRFQHGVAMVAKSIEHRLFHHRKIQGNC